MVITKEEAPKMAAETAKEEGEKGKLAAETANEEGEKGKFAYMTGRNGRPPTSWHMKGWRNWNLWEFIVSLDLCPEEVYTEKPGFDRGPIPNHPLWKENVMILSVGLMPVYLQAAAMHFFPNMAWKPWPTYLFYHLMFIVFAYSNLTRLHYYMKKYGAFDEGVRARDIVDDKHVNHLGASILLYTSLRTAAPFLMVYPGAGVSPFTGFSWWSPAKVCLWLVAIDFWFYIYHSSTHRVDSLWFVHRAHHGTKHPTAILSILADDYQEIIEVVLVPLGASWMVPLTFAEGWTAIVYLLYVEMLGHSGIRAYWPHPLLTPFLRPFDMELAVEDHDLHHRGGRAGGNFGKQTRIFDRICGTEAPRVDGRNDLRAPFF